ncbi:MAG TPA: hypothetical protein VMG38_07330 [Trebonia sp.]|nr:hypothetical protein [Trebonia sp.]
MLYEMAARVVDDHAFWLDMPTGSPEMYRLRRHSGARVAITMVVIGLFALTSATGASAALPSSPASAQSSKPASSTALLSASSPASAAAEGHTKCVPWPKPTSDGLKCTGTFSGNTAWNPWTQQNLPASEQPTVTISQAKNLTDQDVKINWSNFTPTFGADESPEPNPGTDAHIYQVALLECNGTNPDASDGYAKNCYPAAVGTLGTNGPPNAQLATTQDTSVPPNASSQNDKYSPVGGTSPPNNDPATWTGQADFHVEAPTPRTKGGFFRCGPSAPCSLVIDPNWGGIPAGGTDNYTDTSDCGIHIPGNSTLEGDFVGPNGDGLSYGSFGPNGSLDPSAQSSACWVADRIVVPLGFAPTPSNCPNKAPQFYAQGSPMMQLQMAQWQSGWCTGAAPVTLNYTFNSEALARNDFLAGGQAVTARVDMALVTLPADPAAQQTSSRKFTYAPLANSGVDIAYYLDDSATGGQLSKLVLDPRLLAKLTTQSYALNYSGCLSSNAPQPPWPPNPQPNPECDPAVIGNPQTLFDDPEFLSLNKNCQPFGLPASYACENHPAQGSARPYSDFPTDSSNGTDVLQGGFLPTVLAADSDMTYDLTGWIAANSDAESFLAGQDQQDSPYVMHVNNNYLGVSYPVQAFAELDNGASYPGGLPACGSSGCLPIQDETMQASWNFQVDLDTIALDLLTDQPTADEPFDSCSLTATSGTCTNPSQMNPVTGIAPQLLGGRDLLSELDLGDTANYQFPAADLVNAAGKAVGPTQASVEAAVSDMQTNPDGITQFPNFTSTDPKAYPLSMVDYAMVPTCGLSSSEASAIADFLTKAGTTGQAEGPAPGDLGPGYYPLNAKQKAQTLKAAHEVKAQSCGSPPPDRTVGGHTPPADAKPGAKPGRAASPKSARTAKSPSATEAPTGSAASGQTMAFGEKSPDSGTAGILLLLAVIGGVLLLIGGPTAWVVTATGKWPVVLSWLRPVRSRSKAALAWLGGRGVWRS